MDHDTSKTSLQTVIASRKALQDDHDALLEEASGLRARNENLERDVYSKTKLLASVEESNRKEVQKLQTNFKKEKFEIELDLHTQCFSNEDLASGALRREDYVNLQ